MSTFINDIVEWYQVGEALTARDAIYVSDGNDGRTAGRVYKLEVGNPDRDQYAGMTKDAAASAGDWVRVAVAGGLKGFSGLVEGKPVWASVTVAGGYQTTKPEETLQVQVLGTAKSATELVINSALSGSFAANIGAESGGIGDVDTLALLDIADDSLGLTKDESINGETFRLTHDDSVTQFAEFDVTVTPKFRNKNLRLFVDTLTTAASGNFKLIITDETNSSAELVNEVLTPQEGTLPEKKFVTFDTASNTASIKVRFEALAESGSPTSDFDDVVIQLTKSEKVVSEVYELEENEYSARIANNGTASITSQSKTFIQSVNRTGTGTVVITFIPGFFTEIPAITTTLDQSGAIFDAQLTNVSTSSCTIEVYNNSPIELTDKNISIHVSRQGADRKDLTRRVERESSTYNELVVKEDDLILKAAGNAGQSITANVTDIPFILQSDNTGGWNGSQFTVPKSGIWAINGGLSFTAGTSGTIKLYVNGVFSKEIGYIHNQVYGNAFNFLGELIEGDVVTLRIGVGVTLANDIGRHYLNINYQGSLKLAQTIPDSKIEIPSSEVRMEGSSGRGSTATAVVKFDSLAKLRGNDIEVVNTAADGTYFVMKKDGKLSVSVTLGLGSFSYHITKNQATLTTTTPLAGEAFGSASNAGNFNTAAHTAEVKAGDVIRVIASANPTSNAANHVSLYLEETKISVAVTNIQPQFEDADRILEVNGNAGTAVTANVTDIPFTSVVTSQNVDNAWNGSQFIVPEDGLYDIEVGLSFTADATRLIDLYVDGVVYRSIGFSTLQPLEGSFTGKFTKGQVLSIRTDASSTLSNVPTRHYLNISKVGKPSIATADLTPWIRTPNVTFQSYSASLNSSYNIASVYDYSGGGLFTVSDDIANYIVITATVDCMLNATGYVRAPNGTYENATVIVYNSSGNYITIQHNRSDYGVTHAAASATVQIFLRKGDYIRFAFSANESFDSGGMQISAIAQDLERITNIDQTENHFSARINNNGTASIVSQSGPSDWIASVNRTATGTVQINLTSGYFTQAPAVTVTTTQNNRDALVASVSTTSITVITTNEGTDSDSNFDIKVSRQGDDYKSIKDIVVDLGLFNHVSGGVERKTNETWNGEPIYERCYEILSNITSTTTIATIEAGLSPINWMRVASTVWLNTTMTYSTGTGNTANLEYNDSTGVIRYNMDDRTVYAGTRFCIRYTKP